MRVYVPIPAQGAVNTRKRDMLVMQRIYMTGGKKNKIC